MVLNVNAPIKNNAQNGTGTTLASGRKQKGAVPTTAAGRREKSPTTWVGTYESAHCQQWLFQLTNVVSDTAHGESRYVCTQPVSYS